jgi:hypothetical protein
MMHFLIQKMTLNAYILSVRELIRKNSGFFAGMSLAALALRLLFVFRLPNVVDDSRLYADIAINWLQHGVYGITDSGQIMPTLSRLPGYPAFLAAIFAIFGINNFRAVLLIQVLFDLGTCFLLADLARRMFSDRAAKAAFVLAALCPFLANFAAAALTETLEIFFTTLALDLAFRGFTALSECGESHSTPSIRIWLGCGLSIGASMLLRPDGGILFAAVGGYCFFLFVRSILRSRASIRHESISARYGSARHGSARYGSAAPVMLPAPAPPSAFFRVGVIITVAAFAPLVPWTLRNLHTLHRFQPLAPRYANDIDETVMPGFNRWVKTWMADSASVQEIYWRVPGESLDVTRLPNRAFDSAEQRRETEQIFADYDRNNNDLTPEIDARFAALAKVRIHAAPVRYYFLLPAVRIADMWLRPRTELTPSDPRWWEFNDDPFWLSVSIFFGAINLAYVTLAAAGFVRWRNLPGIGLFIFFVVIRSLFLGSLENPETRYTLECYPAVILAAGAKFVNKSNLRCQESA